MTPNEYLDAAKTRLEVKSDYALAKRFEVLPQDITQVRKGKKPLNAYLCAKVAITLELDPAAVLADVQEQHEKNPTRKAFWRSFRSRAQLALIALCTLGLIYSAGIGAGQNPLGGQGLSVLSSILAASYALRRVRIMCIMSTHESAIKIYQSKFATGIDKTIV